MAAPDIVKGTYLDILVGDGASPENFTVVCGLTAKTFTEAVDTSDVFVRDCADPEDIPSRRLNITGQRWSLSGDGLYNRAQAGLIRGLIGISRNYRFVVSEPSADNIDDGWYEGPAVLVNRQIGGPQGANATGSFQIESDGEWTWTDAP
jgi:hypothetical protein